MFQTQEYSITLTSVDGDQLQEIGSEEVVLQNLAVFEEIELENYLKPSHRAAFSLKELLQKLIKLFQKLIAYLFRYIPINGVICIFLPWFCERFWATRLMAQLFCEQFEVIRGQLYL